MICSVPKQAMEYWGKPIRSQTHVSIFKYTQDRGRKQKTTEIMTTYSYLFYMFLPRWMFSTNINHWPAPKHGQSVSVFFHPMEARHRSVSFPSDSPRPRLQRRPARQHRSGGKKNHDGQGIVLPGAGAGSEHLTTKNGDFRKNKTWDLDGGFKSLFIVVI